MKKGAAAAAPFEARSQAGSAGGRGGGLRRTPASRARRRHEILGAGHRPAVLARRLIMRGAVPASAIRAVAAADAAGGILAVRLRAAPGSTGRLGRLGRPDA